MGGGEGVGGFLCLFLRLSFSSFNSPGLILHSSRHSPLFIIFSCHCGFWVVNEKVELVRFPLSVKSVGLIFFLFHPADVTTPPSSLPRGE